MESTQKRIFLWSCPRSLSTAFYRAINNAPGTLGIFEPYAMYYAYEPIKKFECKPTFKAITASLKETQHKDYATIFVKDFAYCITEAPHPIADILSEGYIHTFLIRDPRRSIPSLYKVSTSPGPCGWTNFNWKHGGHKALYELYTYLTQNLGVTCLIVDADDLQEKPEATLKAYCAFCGIPFHQSMINWDMAVSSKFDAFKETLGDCYGLWFNTATSTSAFNKLDGQSSLEVSGHPPIVQEAIKKLMPYYQRMYKEKGIFEPYATYYGCAPTQEMECKPTFKAITASLQETQRKGYTTIFVKDFAYCFTKAPRPIADIPSEGYIHTFLIRDPRRSIPSLYKMSTSPGPCGWTDFNWKQGGHKALYELYTYLTQDLGVTCLVLDADDLQENPEATLKAYCTFCSIPFHQSMVHWDLVDSSGFDAFKETLGDFYGIWFKTATSTSAFNKLDGKSSLDVSGHPPIVQEAIKKLMPYYQRMYDNRLVIN